MICPCDMCAHCTECYANTDCTQYSDYLAECDAELDQIQAEAEAQAAHEAEAEAAAMAEMEAMYDEGRPY